jgi:cytochrome b561
MQAKRQPVKSAWQALWRVAALADLARRLKEPNSDSAWGAPAKLLHWLIAVLILVQFALGWAAVSWRLSPTKLHLFVWHKSLGIVILLLVLVRLVWRLLNLTPTLPREMPAWERGAARLSHGLLYVLMIALPLSGWITQSAAGVPFRIFWRIPLPALVAPDKHLAAHGASLHFSLGLVFTALIVLHIAAA